MLKTQKKLTAAAVAVILACTALTSCGDDDNNPQQSYLYQLVTLDSTSDAGCKFSFQTGGLASPVYTLTAAQRVDTTKVKIGERLMIVYTYANQNISITKPQSGEVNLHGYQQVLNGKIQYGTSDEFGGFTSHTLMNVYAWVTGPWLNIQATGVVKREAKQFELVMDETTRGEQYPTVYLLFTSDDEIDGVARTVISSFDMESFWNDPANYKGFTLKVANQNGQHEWTFNREGVETIKPVS